MTRRDEGVSQFDCDGKTWTLRFDFNAMCDFKQETGDDVFAALTAMADGTPDPVHVRALFWAALRDAHPEVTLREAGRMVMQGMDALQKAALSALPTPAAGDDAEKTTAAPSRAA